MIVEIPEGRHVVEIPPPPSVISGTKSERVEESENHTSDDIEASFDESPLRKHRHHPVNRSHPSTAAAQEEQADEAVIQNMQLNRTAGPVAMDSADRLGKNGAGSGNGRIPTTTQRYHSHILRLSSSPAPTLATLEDHDLFKESLDDEQMQIRTGDVVEDSRMMQRPQTSKFIQRMLMSQQQQQPRSRGKEGKNTKRAV